MSFVEEFAPESYDHNICVSTKRYATQSSLNTDSLKKENLIQIQESLDESDSDDDSKIRYLKLDLANKELEIIELKEKIANLEKMNSAIYDINTVLETVFKNSEDYDDLYKKIDNYDLRELIKKEMLIIKPHALPKSLDILPKYIQTSCRHLYNKKKEDEKHYAIKFQNSVFYKNQFDEFLFHIQILLTIILILLYTYYFIGLV